MRRSPEKGFFNNNNKDKERTTTMISVTSKNGQSVRLDANYDIDAGRAEFTVACEGTTVSFPEFAPAARFYRALSRRINENAPIVEHLDLFAKVMGALGYDVSSPASKPNCTRILETINSIEGLAAFKEYNKIVVQVIDGSARNCLVADAIAAKPGFPKELLRWESSDEASAEAYYIVRD